MSVYRGPAESESRAGELARLDAELDAAYARLRALNPAPGAQMSPEYIRESDEIMRIRAQIAPLRFGPLSF